MAFDLNLRPTNLGRVLLKVVSQHEDVNVDVTYIFCVLLKGVTYINV